jgi:dihydrofolate synthase/folylpolyglutamate synthase
MEQTGFSSSHDVFQWLGKFVNLEQGVKPPSMRPERMQIIAAAAGRPEQGIPAIHVAGSKGKGSITAMVSAILSEAGFRVARYLSPHITEYRERITLHDAFFDETVYIRAGNRLRAVEEDLLTPGSEGYNALSAVSDGAAADPTFFELLTLYYFLCAKEARCNALAVETGMGGRLDPTNIVQSRAAVITGIELEHTDMLGDTIAKIATEKAGIIKEGCPVIIGEQIHRDAADACAVFKKTAREKNAELFYFPEIAEIKNVHVDKEGTSWTLHDKSAAFFPRPLELSIALIGEVQAENTSLAAFAVRKAFPEIPLETIQNALRQVRLPARFEKIASSPDLVIDGAHTDISVQLCAQTWERLYGRGAILIFGCAQGKNADAMARALLPLFSKIYITTPGTYKISEPEKVFEVFQHAAGREGAPSVQFIKDTEACIQTALTDAKAHNLPLLGIGSFYLAAEIRNAVFHAKMSED